jgi:hypothetical protein
MEQSEQDAGTLAALIERLQQFRLPRMRRILERVNNGEPLSDADFAFLKKVYTDSRGNQGLIRRNPEYMRIVSGVIDLYGEIITKSLENERALSEK